LCLKTVEVAHMRGREAKLHPPAATPAKEGSRTEVVR